MCGENFHLLSGTDNGVMGKIQSCYSISAGLIPDIPDAPKRTLKWSVNF